MKKTFYQKYAFGILCVTAFLLAFIWMGTKRTLESNANNVADWLPADFQETKDYKWFLGHFPFETFIVASWEGCTLDDPRLEMLAQKLVPGQTIDDMDSLERGSNVRLQEVEIAPSKYDKAFDFPKASEDQEDKVNSADDPALRCFKSVLTGPRLIRMMMDRYSQEEDKNKSTYLSYEQILERLDGTLIGPSTRDGVQLDSGQRKTALIVSLIPGIQGKDLRVVVAKIKELARECGIEPVVAPDNRSSLKKIIDGIGNFFYELVYERKVSTAGIILGGPPIDNVAIDYEGARTLTRLAGLCGAIGLTIAWLCLRSISMTLIVFSVSVLSAGISLALVTFTGGQCDAILLSMPALVYVLTMAASIHIINYYFDAIRETGLEGAPEKAIRSAWYPCTIASLTGVFGLDSLYMSNLVPIVKFGNYSAIGVLCALAMLFLVLPSLLYYFPARKYADKYAGKGVEAQANGYLYRFWSTLGKWIVRHHKLVIIVCLSWMIVSTWGLCNIKTSVKMMRFFSSDSEIINHYTWLEEQLGPLVPMEVVVKFDNEKCRLRTFERMQYIDELCKKIREELPHEVGGVMSASTVAPDLEMTGTPGTFAWTARFAAINGMLDRRREEMQDYLTVEKVSFDRSQYGDREQDFQNAISQMGITWDEAAKLCVAGIYSHDILLFHTKDRIFPGLLPEELDRLREKVENWQKRHGTDLWRISMRVWALKKDDIDYAKFIERVKGVVDPLNLEKSNEGKTPAKDAITAVYTGIVPVVYKTQNALLSGLQQALVLAFTSIMVMLMFVLKSPVAGFLTMIPNILPVFVVFGFLGFAGILVDIGTMMTASVALGIAVDDTVHYLTWFRAGMDRGLEVQEAALEAYEKCAEAMTETTWVCGFGLAAFAFSTFAPTQMFGVMMLTLLTTALIGALIFLPALVASPLGKYYYNKKSPKRKTVSHTNNASIKLHESTTGKSEIF